jgi:hypothetical protein
MAKPSRTMPAARESALTSKAGLERARFFFCLGSVLSRSKECTPAAYAAAGCHPGDDQVEDGLLSVV